MTSRTRLTPQARQRQIVEVARSLFAARPYAEVTVAEVAREAGVTRALVHHYFGTVREIYLAVLSEITAEGVEIPGDIAGVPRDERVARNVAAWLDLIAANRETWLALTTQATAVPDPHIRQLIQARRDDAVARMIAANADLITDSAAARLALRAQLDLFASVCDQWLRGQATRTEAEALMTRTFLDLVERTIPALAASAPGSSLAR